MFEHAAVPQFRPSSESLRRRCAACSHTEFVHADGGPRWCLFSECSCADYTIALPSLVVAPLGGGAA